MYVFYIRETSGKFSAYRFAISSKSKAYLVTFWLGSENGHKNV